jgi:5-(carboxyamino)imidazole ribonucleotide mutase
MGRNMKKELVDVVIIIVSASDRDKMDRCSQTLIKFGVPHNYRVASVNRTPEAADEIVRIGGDDGCKIFICAAGMAAHLAGAVASKTIKPVIGVPMTPKEAGGLNGLDALFSTVQMPTGVPVATVAIDAAENAAILAIQILAINNAELAFKLRKYREELAEKVHEADEALKAWQGR